MQPFKRVEMPESEYEAIRKDLLQKWRSKDSTIVSLIPAAGEDAVRAWIDHYLEDLKMMLLMSITNIKLQFVPVVRWFI
jgi:hypothetical protein